MPKKPIDATLIEIEQSQTALRASIEQAKDLSAESERRIRRRRTEAPENKPPNPAS